MAEPLYDESADEDMKNNVSLLSADKLRSVGRWYIGETLGKGGYSWVKKGYDKKTGKSVALKFMAKAENSWAQEQAKQIKAEIESLKQIRHPHVMKLYAYNLNAKYPAKNKDKVDAILLVLEYAPGGELFDILYYTSALEEEIARTYFLQMINGIEACHKAGVCHRDIKPQNLLLDSKFNLRLTDFGLSKVFQSDSDAIMKTTYVGTKGYQAPELLLNKSYDLSCDIFSAGVVLFILLTGYPPFEQASKKDKWFAPLATNDNSKFWKAHKGCTITDNEKVKDLIIKMLCFDPKKRITIDEIKAHPWCLGKVLEGKALINVLRGRHRNMEAKRKTDAKKLSDLQVSITTRNLDFNIQDLPLLPSGEIEGIYDLYTTIDWKDALSTIYSIIGEVGGHIQFYGDSKLEAIVKAQIENVSEASLIRFEITCWKSRKFDKKSKNDEEKIYIIRVKRLDGDVMDYRNIVKELILKKSSCVITGLPQWAENELYEKDEDNTNDNYDDYDEILSLEGDAL